MNPVGHHFTSLLLHAANTALLFLWLSTATGFAGRSAFVAAIFGLHPLHVESAAWVAERKDVLSAFFVFLALTAYTRYARSPSIARYIAVAATFVCGLLSKPMVVTLPVLLLVLDRWPLDRKMAFRRLAIEKVPLLALSALCIAATLWAQSAAGSIAPFDALAFGLRSQNAAVAYVAYIGKALWPAKLAIFYPFPLNGVPAWKTAAAAALITGLGLPAWLTRRTHPWVAAGLLWYFISLLPAIGLIQAGMQSMADRYMYLPLIGLSIAVIWELAHFRVARFAAPLVLAGFAVLTIRQISYWRDGLTIWRHALDVTEGNFVAHDNLGVELDARGRGDEALDQYREALEIRPSDSNALSNFAQASFAKGERLQRGGRNAEALASFRAGLRYKPDNALAHSYAGAILTQTGDLAGAITEFRQATTLDPSLSRGYMGLGVALAQSGRVIEAESAMRQAIAKDASSIEAQYDLGLIEAAMGKRREALVAFGTALRIDPNYQPAKEAVAALREK
jgi:Flp pilus assembly protein TadD